MRRILLAFWLVLLSITSLTAESKWCNAIVHFKNGEKLECQAEKIAPWNNEFSIRRDVNSKKEKLKKSDIKVVEMVYEDGMSRIFCNIPYVNFDKAAKGDYSKTVEFDWLPLSKVGYVTLFHYVLNASCNNFYLKRADTDFAIALITGKTVDKKSKKALALFFADYPELAQSLEKRKIKSEEVESIVDEYNQWHESQQGK